MRSKVIRYVCGVCGAQLSGIGDWVEHACRSTIDTNRVDARESPRRWPAQVSQVYRRRTSNKRIKRASELPAKRFEQLLTDDDRAWMRDLEKAFYSPQEFIGPPAGPYFQTDPV